jgi:hypothetical protein
VRVYDRSWPYDAWAAGSCGDILVDAVAGVGGMALCCWCGALCLMDTPLLQLEVTLFPRLQRLFCPVQVDGQYARPPFGNPPFPKPFKTLRGALLAISSTHCNRWG